MSNISNIFRRLDQFHQYQPVILITGCSSGIGLALANIFYITSKYRTVITARKSGVAKLLTMFPERPNFMIEELDVTDEKNRISLYEKISATWGGVDILINNAGISYRSVVEHMTEHDEILQMKTNYLGPMGLIRLCLPYMREKGRGKLINISSVSGMLSVPTMSAYSASKRALEGACESLWYEVRPFGIDVCLIQPGFVRSQSFKNVHYSQLSQKSSEGNGPYSDLYQSMTPFIEKLMNLSRSSSEDVAQLVYKTVQSERPALWISATFDASLFYYFRRLLPRRLLLPFLYFLLPNSMKWGANHTHKRS